jgi:hypothetical protein
MPWAQGVYFRSTDNQTNPTDFDAEVNFGVTYPWNTAQGNDVGWESSIGNDRRDRDTTTDVRLKGVHFASNSSTWDFRIDLPSAGAYRVGCAIGDGGSSQTNCSAVLLDGSSVFQTIITDVNIASADWYDAAGNLHTTEALFVSNEQLVEHTFTSTILRVRIGGSLQSGNTAIAFLYVESVGGEPSNVVPRRSMKLCHGV